MAAKVTGKKQQLRKRECNAHAQKIYVKVKVHKNTHCFVVWFMIIILLLSFFSSFYSFTRFFSFSCLFLFFRSKYFKISLMKQLPFSRSTFPHRLFSLLFFVVFQISIFLSSVNFYRIILFFFTISSDIMASLCSEYFCESICSFELRPTCYNRYSLWRI